MGEVLAGKISPLLRCLFVALLSSWPRIIGHLVPLPCPVFPLILSSTSQGEERKGRREKEARKEGWKREREVGWEEDRAEVRAKKNKNRKEKEEWRVKEGGGEG